MLPPPPEGVGGLLPLKALEDLVPKQQPSTANLPVVTVLKGVVEEVFICEFLSNKFFPLFFPKSAKVRQKREAKRQRLAWPKYCGSNGEDCTIVNSKLRESRRLKRHKREASPWAAAVPAPAPVTPPKELDCEHVVIIQLQSSNLILCVFQHSVKVNSNP